MSRVLTFVAFVSLTALIGQPALAEFITNGNFETADGTGWNINHADALNVQDDSVIAGSYSGELVMASGRTVRQNPVDVPSDFVFKMDFAVFPQIGTADRTMHLALFKNLTDSLPVINMRVNAADDKLQAFGGGSWQDIGTLEALTTTDTGTSNRWDGEDPVVNTLEIRGYFSAESPYYDVTLNNSTVTGLNWFHAPIAQNATIQRLSFEGRQTWLVDNVSLIPEPSTLSMVSVALLLAVAPWRRKKGSRVTKHACSRREAMRAADRRGRVCR